MCFLVLWCGLIEITVRRKSWQSGSQEINPSSRCLLKEELRKIKTDITTVVHQMELEYRYQNPCRLYLIFHDIPSSDTYEVRAVSIAWRTIEASQNRIHLTQFRIFIEVELDTVCGPTAYPAAVVFRTGRSDVEWVGVADAHSLTGRCVPQRIREGFPRKIGTRRNNIQHQSQKHPAI